MPIWTGARASVAGVVLSVLLAGCATVSRRGPVDGGGHGNAGVAGVVLEARPAPDLDDDLPLAPLLDAVEAEIAALSQASHHPRVTAFRFGDRSIPRDAYLDGMRRFVALGRGASSTAEFLRAVKRDFDFYEAVSSSPVLVTAYYEPIIHGSRRPTRAHPQALYRVPPDLRAPSYTRAEIDSGHKLDGQDLELCYIDPLDAFDLQTEGSGVVVFADGSSLPLDYAGNNGQPHQRLGRLFAGKIPPGQLNKHTMTAYLRSLSESAMRELLNQNPRYVFFKPRTGVGASTSIGLAATDGRTIAADSSQLPKGALGFLVAERPIWPDATTLAPSGFAPFRRFVLDQDTGSGIKGAHIDLYWGSGEEAGRNAGVMKQRGRLYYLAPRSP